MQFQQLSKKEGREGQNFQSSTVLMSKTNDLTLSHCQVSGHYHQDLSHNTAIYFIEAISCCGSTTITRLLLEMYWYRHILHSGNFSSFNISIFFIINQARGNIFMNSTTLSLPLPIRVILTLDFSLPARKKHWQFCCGPSLPFHAVETTTNFQFSCISQFSPMTLTHFTGMRQEKAHAFHKPWYGRI